MACYSYGVPCVVSPDLSDYCKGLVISTVNNLDIVSTLSLGVLRDLKVILALIRTSSSVLTLIR
jgi:hypothetical protein